jgi:TonB family protein
LQALYPQRALTLGEQGIMWMRVIVSPEGAVEDCVIHKGTNTLKLDSPACGMMKLAEFEPARDALGRPFRSYYATTITYRIG